MWQSCDFEAYASMSADPRVMEFLSPDGKTMSRAEAWRSFAAQIGHWHLRGFGMFAVIERASNDLVGRVGPWQPEGWPDFEIGWSLRSGFWGRGFAVEAAAACVEYAFTALDRTHLISVIDPANVRSIRVAERVGELLEGETSLPHLPDRKLLKYGLHRKDWSPK